jgi:uncharacterized protein (DUF736 family)
MIVERIGIAYRSTEDDGTEILYVEPDDPKFVPFLQRVSYDRG